MRLLILDRDGVINADSESFIRSPEDWQPLPGSLEAIAQASEMGFRIVVVSNQSGLARGLFTIEDLNAINAKMHKHVTKAGGRIDAVFFCPHGPDDGCTCRKPSGQLLVSIAERLRIDLSDTYFIGDRISDVTAARAAGARPILVCTGHGASERERLADSSVPVFDDLSAAVGWLASALPPVKSASA